RLVITCRESVVDVPNLPEFLRDYDSNTATFTVRPGMPLAEIEKMVIRQTLTHISSNRGEAAKVLGISRRALQYKLKQYGLLDDLPRAAANDTEVEPNLEDPTSSS